MPKNVLRVGFFLDGYTLKKVNEYYRLHHRFHSNIDFRGLKNWVQLQVMNYFGNENSSIVMESHYYHPYREPGLCAGNPEGVLKLEAQLNNAGFQVHYNDRIGEEGGLGPNLCLMEDALLFASYSKIDAAVLLSTQGQFAPLPDRLRLMGVPTVLLGWNFFYPKAKHRVHWKTDSCLRDNCAHYVAMERVMDRNPGSSEPPRNFFFQCERPFGYGTSGWNKKGAYEAPNGKTARLAV